MRLTIPWACLASDNLRKRYTPGKGDKAWGRYKSARDTASTVVQAQYHGPMYCEAVSMEILFYLPNDRRRDPTNLLKMVQDSLSGIIYDDDKRITSLSWLNMGVDRDNPRAEVTVMPGTLHATWAEPCRTDTAETKP